MSEFKSYRAKELTEVPIVGNTYKMKVIGTNGESKWLTITATELERIVAVLEPEDYRQAVPAEVRITLPKMH